MDKIVVSQDEGDDVLLHEEEQKTTPSSSPFSISSFSSVYLFAVVIFLTREDVPVRPSLLALKASLDLVNFYYFYIVNCSMMSRILPLLRRSLW